jgi:hypothetical protein
VVKLNGRLLGKHIRWMKGVLRVRDRIEIIYLGDEPPRLKRLYVKGGKYTWYHDALEKRIVVRRTA